MDPINTGPNNSVAASTPTFNGPWAGTPTTGASASKGPDKNDFLKLLVTQLQHQDPMNPMQDREFITQLAQFNALEEMQKLNTNFAALQASNDVQLAASLLGKTVEYQDALGETQTGEVKEVGWQSGTPKLTIDDKEVELTNIVSVR